MPTASVDLWKGSGTVLVVDDEPAVLRTVARMMELMGFSALKAADGQQGIDLFRAHAADIALVMLDLSMPRLDGEQTFAELRRIRPDARVMLMSGFSAHESVARFAGQGLAGFVQKYFLGSAAVRRLNVPDVASTKSLQPAIREFRKALQHASYDVPQNTLADGEVQVTPLLGFRRSDSMLNDALLGLLRGTRERLIVLTPYFNLPRPVRVVLGQLLRRGCHIDIMVGDKTANDFYIPPSEPFKTIALLPYLYENNLRRFARTHRRQVESGQLNLHLWRDGDNSYHLKGLLIDDDVAVLTGNNLNPRAWSLDLENGLILRDPSRLLHARHRAEWTALRKHSTRLADYHALESPRSYPREVRKLLKRLTRTQLDRLLNRLL